MGATRRMKRTRHDSFEIPHPTGRGTGSESWASTPSAWQRACVRDFTHAPRYRPVKDTHTSQQERLLATSKIRSLVGGRHCQICDCGLPHPPILKANVVVRLGAHRPVGAGKLHVHNLDWDSLAAGSLLVEHDLTNGKLTGASTLKMREGRGGARMCQVEVEVEEWCTNLTKGYKTEAGVVCEKAGKARSTAVRQ